MNIGIGIDSFHAKSTERSGVKHTLNATGKERRSGGADARRGGNVLFMKET